MLRPTVVEERVELLPASERSLGEVFRSLLELAWIADDSTTSYEEHRVI